MEIHLWNWFHLEKWREKLIELFGKKSKMHSTTKYREEWSKACINFLDLHVLLKIKKTYFDDDTAWIVFVFRVFLVGIFPNSTWIRRDTEYLSVFSLNAGKYGPAKLWIRTLFFAV